MTHEHAGVGVGVGVGGQQRRTATGAVASLKVFRPLSEPGAAEPGGLAAWPIPGGTAVLILYTPEEWAGLRIQPEDSKPFGNGVMGVLRVEATPGK
jgi:hypothetical protein